MPEFLYPLIAFTLLGLLLAYFYVARRYDVIDLPTERSSHLQPTIRGGGIVFTFAAVIWFLVSGFCQPWAIGGLFLIAIVNLFEDLYGVSKTLRFLTQLMAVSFLFYQLNLFGLPWYLLITVYIIATGWINAFNFMDGINGITPFYSLVALSTFLYLNTHIDFANVDLIVFLLIAVIIFAFFNARKRARTFPGDVGSSSMAFLLAWIMTSLIIYTGNLAWLLLFSVYGIDSAITILIRLRRGENIFKAHRLHLYQLLSNEKRWPHLKVATLYALVQLTINAIVIILIFKGIMNLFVFFMLLLFFTSVYGFLRYRTIV